MTRAPIRLIASAIGPLLTIGCGTEMVAPEPGPPAVMRRLGGDFQTSDPSEDLPRRLIVRVTDSAGVVVPEVLVMWSVQGGGVAIPDTVRTDVGGKASTQVRLTDYEGDRTVRAALASDPNVRTDFLVFVNAAPGSGGGIPDVVVEVGDSFFDPKVVSIERGQIVEWRWVGAEPHNVVFMDTTITPRNSVGGTTIRRSGSWQHCFTERGAFDYGCLVHGFPSQNGRVQVN